MNPVPRHLKPLLLAGPDRDTERSWWRRWLGG